MHARSFFLHAGSKFTGKQLFAGQVHGFQVGRFARNIPLRVRLVGSVRRVEERNRHHHRVAPHRVFLHAFHFVAIRKKRTRVVGTGEVLVFKNGVGIVYQVVSVFPVGIEIVFRRYFLIPRRFWVPRRNHGSTVRHHRGKLGVAVIRRVP